MEAPARSRARASTLQGADVIGEPIGTSLPPIPPKSDRARRAGRPTQTSTASTETTVVASSLGDVPSATPASPETMDTRDDNTAPVFNPSPYASRSFDFTAPFPAPSVSADRDPETVAHRMADVEEVPRENWLQEFRDVTPQFMAELHTRHHDFPSSISTEDIADAFIRLREVIRGMGESEPDESSLTFAESLVTTPDAGRTHIVSSPSDAVVSLYDLTRYITAVYTESRQIGRAHV